MISSLPIILRQGLRVLVKKVPILLSLPVSDSSFTFGLKRSDENPTPTVGNSAAK